MKTPRGQHAHRFTPDDYDAWERDYRAGKTLDAIAKAAGCYRSTVFRRLERRGVPMRPTATYRAVIALLQAGVPPREVPLVLDVSVMTVWRHRRTYKETRRHQESLDKS